MFNVVGDINWLAVALSTVALTALGGVWFAALFAKPYAQALGRDPEQPPEMTTVSYVGPSSAACSPWSRPRSSSRSWNITSAGDAFVFGCVVGIGYLVATMTNVAINPDFPRPVAYAAVNGPHFALSGLIPR